MKRILLSIALLTSTIGAFAQVAVTVTNPSNSTPALAGTYSSLSAAITALNATTSFSGPVTLTCTNGTETAPAGGYVINFTATTSATNNVIIDGGNSTITASNALTAGNLNDAIFKIIGSDYVTLKNFIMQENVANTTTAAATNNMTEWGVALLYASATNGAQNNTIQSNTISLNRTYQNTFGIYSNSTHTATAATTSATATSSNGGNSGLHVYSNNISNVNMGICVAGPTAAADQNTGIDIGGTSNTTGNTITNFGSTGTFSAYANVSTTVNGILVRNSKGFNVSNNSITSSTGATGVTAGTLYGIQIPAASNTATGTFINNINNNVLSLTSNVTAGAINGISVGSATGSTGCTFNVNSNDFANIKYTPTTASGTVVLIAYSNGATALTTNINSNTFSNLSINTSGSVTFISRSGAMASGNSETVSNNAIIGNFAKTIAGGTIAFYTTAVSGSVLGSTMNHNSNNFSNVSIVGSTAVVGWSNGDGVTSANCPLKFANNNTFNNIVASSTPTGSITIMNVNACSDGSTVSGNTISNIASGGSCVGIGHGANSNGTITISGNNIFGISAAGGNLNAISSQASAAMNITGNAIYNLSESGAFQINGIITTAGSTLGISKNNIHDISAGNASASINGIAYTSGTTINVYNNFISALSIPVSNSSVAIIGIYNAGGTNTNIYYNTVVLGKSAPTTSSGTNFGLSGIQYVSTSNVTVKNNVIWIDATPNGTGTIGIIRRSTAGTAGTAPTSTNFSANNNIYNLQNPGANKYLYVEGTTVGAVRNGYGINIGIADDATNNLRNDPNFNSGCSLYKAFMGSGREGGTFNENNLVASGTPDYTFTPSGTSFASNTAQNITSPNITDDYNGNVRSSTPDIGALEFSGNTIDATAPAISFNNLSNTNCTAAPSLNATITDANGVNVASGTAPRLYFRKAGGAAPETDAFLNYPAENTSAFNGWKYVEATGTAPNFSFALDYSLLASPVVDGDSIAYFVVAQDVNGNVGKKSISFPSNFCPASVNLPSTGATPTSASLGYKISAATATFTTIADGEWNNPGTWSCGMIPAASTTNVVIANNITVSNTGNIAGSTTINTGASLTINTNGELTLGNTGGGKIAFVNNGTLNVNDGVFTVNGNVLINNGANFSQTGGLFAEDGNAAGVAANSVASGTPLFSIGTTTVPYGSGNISLTGGTLRIVDPHTATTNTSGYAFLYVNSLTTASANLTPSGTHVFELGDGISTASGGTTSGYYLNFWELNGGFKPNILRINAPTGTNRKVSSAYTPFTTSSLDVVNGEFTYGSTNTAFVINKNINVSSPGIFTIGGTVILANGVYDPGAGTLDYAAPSVDAQVIGGTGIIRNATTATANFLSLMVNNTNSDGVTLGMPISLSGTFTPTAGILNTTATNLLTVGISGASNANAGVIATTGAGWVNGPIKKWFTSTVGTGSTALLPVGNATTYKPVTIAYTTAATAAGTLTANWSSVTPAEPAPALTEGTLTVDKVSNQGSWFINAGDGLTGGNYTGTFTANGSPDVIDFTKTVLVKRPSTGGAWVLDGTHVTTTGSNTAPVLSRTNMSGFSEFAIGGQSLVALPIDIVYFRGNKQDKANVLDWKVNCTKSINMELEKSDDSKNFKAIYTENATAARCENSFSYIDNNLSSGVNYYRLKVTGPDGKVKYSKIISFSNNEGRFELVNIVPNPVISSAILVFNAVDEGNTNIVVTDAAGRIVLKQRAWINTGKTSVNMDFSKLAKGVYNISATDENGQLQTVRFVKE